MDEKASQTAEVAAIKLHAPGEIIPTPELVRSTAAEIRKSWPPEERRRRANLARLMFWRQFRRR